MSIYKELSYFDNDISTIKGIRFCVLSPDEIKRASVAEITKTDTFDRNDPVPNGLFDARMGVLDNNKICQTCQQKNTFCPGHFGHIELAEKVPHPLRTKAIIEYLTIFCKECHRMVLHADKIKFLGYDKFKGEMKYRKI